MCSIPQKVEISADGWRAEIQPRQQLRHESMQTTPRQDRDRIRLSFLRSVGKCLDVCYDS